MRVFKNGTRLTWGLLLAAAFATQGALAQGVASTSTDRLFLSFAEEAVLADRQWWEGQLEFADLDPTDAVILRGVVALQPLEDLEFGGRVGFGNTDAPAGLEDGSGATDLDLWAKYVFRTQSEGTSFALGGIATIPTGDDSVGLGFDAFGIALFGSVRVAVNDLIVSGNIGARLNDDGKVQGFDLNGRTSPFVAGGVLYPLSDRVSVVGELRFEDERFDGFDSDIRMLGGLNWRLFSQGVVRAAVAIGLDDGAPDSQLIVGYAQSFR